MTHLLILAFLISAASFSAGSPTAAVRQFVLEGLTLASMEAERICSSPRGTKSNPVQVEGLPAGSVETMIVAGLVGFEIESVTVHKVGSTYNLKANIHQPQVEVSGDLRVANISGSSRFFYNVDHKMTLEGTISHKDSKLRVQGELRAENLRTKADLFLQNNEFNEFADAVKSYLKIIVEDCNGLLVKYVSNHLDKQLSQHNAQDIFAGAAHPRPRRLRRQVHNINAYADYILKSYEPTLKKVDPTDLPDRHENFSSNSILLPVKAEVFFSKGKLSGISSLHRAGDVQYSPVGHKMRFVIPLGVNDLKQQYTASLTLGSFNKEFEVISSVTNLQVTFILEQGLAFRSIPILQEVRVTKIGQIKIQYKGVGPLDWMLSRLATFFANSIRWDLVKHVEALLKSVLHNLVRTAF